MNKTVGICWDLSWVEKKIKEIQSLENQIIRLQDSVRTLFVKRETEAINPIKIKISEALKQFAEEKGYLVIVDRAAFDEGIVIGTNDDVTDEFIKYYNSLAAKQQ